MTFPVIDNPPVFWKAWRLPPIVLPSALRNAVLASHWRSPSMSTARMSAAPDENTWMLPPTVEPASTFTRAAPSAWMLPSTNTPWAWSVAWVSTKMLPSTVVPFRVQVALSGT